MKKVELNTSDKLIALKESISKRLDDEIHIKKLGEYFEKNGKMTLGAMRELFQSSILEVNATSAVGFIKKYLTIIKGNKSLTNCYLLYNSIQALNGDTDKNVVVSLVNDACAEINKTELEEGEGELLALVKDCVLETQITIEQVEELGEKDKEIYEAIEYLVKSKRTTKNMVKRGEALTKICNYVSKKPHSDSAEQDNITVGNVIEELKKISHDNMEDWERQASIDIVMGKLSGKDKQELFDEYKNKCLAIIDKIEVSDSIEDKSKFAAMAEKIRDKQFNENTFNDDMFKLSELRSTLKKELEND